MKYLVAILLTVLVAGCFYPDEWGGGHHHYDHHGERR